MSRMTEEQTAVEAPRTAADSAAASVPEVSPAKRDRLWTPDFVVLLGVSLCSFISCQGLNNGSALYVTRLGGLVALAGALITVFSLAAGATRIVLGRLLDRGSCRAVLVFGAVCFFIGTAGALVFPGVGPQFVLRAFQGIGFSCTTTASSKGAADVVPRARMGEGVGYYSLGQSLGMAIGPPTVVALADMPFAEAQFVGFSLVTALLILFAALTRYESHPEKLPETSGYRVRMQESVHADDKTHTVTEKKQSLLESLFVKTAIHGALPTFFTCAVNSLVTAFVALYGTQLGIPNPGLFFLCMAITMTVVRVAGGTLFDRVKPIVLFAVPMAFGIVALAILNLWPTFTGFLIAGVCFGMNMGIALPLLNSVCVKCTVPERWGSASAMYLLAMDVGVGVSSVIWGIIIDTSGYPVALLVGIALLVITYLVALLAFPRNLGPRGLE